VSWSSRVCLGRLGSMVGNLCHAQPLQLQPVCTSGGSEFLVGRGPKPVISVFHRCVVSAKAASDYLFMPICFSKLIISHPRDTCEPESAALG